jgi:DNA-binding NarL/FixJ family response regulator
MGASFGIAEHLRHRPVRARSGEVMMRQPPTEPELLVAHPVPLLAHGLAAVLGPAAGVASACDAAALLAHPAPEVLVTDLPLATAVLTQARPQPGRSFQPWRCVVVSTQASSWTVRQAMQQGVLAMVQACCSVTELQRAVAAARAGQHFLCSASAALLAEGAVDEPLTRRETEVLQLLCLGLDNKSIALRLTMALGTVKTHVKAILEKLDVGSRTQAVAAAHRRGLVPQAPAGSASLSDGVPATWRHASSVALAPRAGLGAGQGQLARASGT